MKTATKNRIQRTDNFLVQRSLIKTSFPSADGNSVRSDYSIRATGLLALCVMFCLAMLPNLAHAASCESPIKVSSGDTLSEIAQRCGSSVSALLVNNPHVDESGAVKVGEKIYLPPIGQSYSATALDQLLAPIALHPDVLLSEILPASTYPLEIVQAARWQTDNPHSKVNDEQPWADSVKALTRYPDVLAQLNDDINWTQQLGEAFLSQPDDVVDSVQRLRRQADKAGNLKDNDVQDIVHEDSSRDNSKIIRIVHSDPYYVHVPRYDHHRVYTSGHGYSGSAFHFGAGLLLGGWLHNTLDWHHGHLFYQPYHTSSYQRFYRYNRYQPYTSYARNSNYYSNSPYTGYRWRHRPGYYGLNGYARHSIGSGYRSTGYPALNQRRNADRYRAQNRYNDRRYNRGYNRGLNRNYDRYDRRNDGRRYPRHGDATNVRTRNLITPNNGSRAAVPGNRNNNQSNSNRRDNRDYNTRAWKRNPADVRRATNERRATTTRQTTNRQTTNRQTTNRRAISSSNRAVASRSQNTRRTENRPVRQIRTQRNNNTLRNARAANNQTQARRGSSGSQSRSYQHRVRLH